MTKSLFTFFYYITHYNSDNISNFLTHFNEDLNILPDNICSSKYLLKTLKIDSNKGFKIFQNAYMDYFKEKLEYN